MKTRKVKVVVTMMITMSMLITLCACGDKSKEYLGTYVGQQGSVLILESNSTCKYKDGNDDDTEKGTWSIENDKIIVKECLDYDIYADIENTSNSLLFQSDDSHWNDELFIKSN